MKFLKSKKGMIDAFDISGRLGYYVLTILMVSVLFIFLAVLLQGSEVKYYKSNYGSNVVNLEERVFNLIEYRDELTAQQYSKVIDFDRITRENYGDEDSCGEFSLAMGVDDVYDRKGVKVHIFSSDGNELSRLSTCNFVEGRHDIEKHYPVLYRSPAGDYVLAEVRLFFWKP